MTRPLLVMLAAAALAVGCATGAGVKTVARADGSIYVRCPGELAGCVREVVQSCNHDNFVVLRAVERHNHQGRVLAFDVAEEISSELVVRCRGRLAGEPSLGDYPLAAATESPPPAPEPPPPNPIAPQN